MINRKEATNIIYKVYINIHQFLFVHIFSFINNNFLQKAISNTKKDLFSTLADEQQRTLKNHKRELELLEIGTGDGTNLQYYPDGCNLTSVDPNPYFETKFRSNHFQFKNKFKSVKFIEEVAEDMSEVKTGSIDVVVMTWVLCSVSDTSKAIKEIHRVLRPGGRFYFFEHTRYERKDFPRWALAQMYLQPIWTWATCGCNLRPTTPMLFEEANNENGGIKLFKIDSCNFSYDTIESKWLQRIVFPIVPHTYGVATKI